jgi:hypothetical protein
MSSRRTASRECLASEVGELVDGLRRLGEPYQSDEALVEGGASGFKVDEAWVRP